MKIKKRLLTTSKYWYISFIIFGVLEILNYGVLGIFVPLNICFYLSALLIILLATYFHFLFSSRNDDLKMQIETKFKEFSNNIENIEKHLKRLDKYNQSYEEIINSTLEDIQNNIKRIPDTILLPIGQCSIMKDDKNGEIHIMSDGKQYKFGIENGKITTYMKNGELERYGNKR